MSGSPASASPASAPSAQQSCPLFATHFVRNGIFNYAIVQGDKSVQYATFSISERQTNSSIATRTYSGRADKPVALYQWTQEDATPADAPETASSDAASGATATAAYSGGGSSSSGLCFTFPVNKGCTYFIQIDFGLTSCAGGSSSTIHWFVDPNKRRLVPKGTAAAAASKKRIADNDAASSAANPASSSASSDAAANPAAEPSSAAKKPRKAAAAGGKSSAAAKTAASASTISVQA